MKCRSLVIIFVCVLIKYVIKQTTNKKVDFLDQAIRGRLNWHAE